MEKRNYSRIKTDIFGTLYKDGIEIPITICNLSENGIGIRYKYNNCPTDFCINKGDLFTLCFFDQTNFMETKDIIQVCEFKVVHMRMHTTHAYIGGTLTGTSSEYSQYVQDKKTERFIGMVRYIGQPFVPQKEVVNR